MSEAKRVPPEIFDAQTDPEEEAFWEAEEYLYRYAQFLGGKDWVKNKIPSIGASAEIIVPLRSKSSLPKYFISDPPLESDETTANPTETISVSFLAEKRRAPKKDTDERYRISISIGIPFDLQVASNDNLRGVGCVLLDSYSDDFMSAYNSQLDQMDLTEGADIDNVHDAIYSMDPDTLLNLCLSVISENELNNLQQFRKTEYTLGNLAMFSISETNYISIGHLTLGLYDYDSSDNFYAYRPIHSKETDDHAREYAPAHPYGSRLPEETGVAPDDAPFEYFVHNGIWQSFQFDNIIDKAFDEDIFLGGDLLSHLRNIKALVGRLPGGQHIKL